MDGNPSTRSNVTGNRISRTKKALDALLVFTDIAALILAFVLAYAARQTLPLFSIPQNQPDFSIYIPTLMLQLITISGLFYFSRMYHQPRAISRIDMTRNIIGMVTIGSLMVMGFQELIFKNSLADPIDYPRSMFFYVLAFSIVLVTAGRLLNRALVRQLRIRGIERDPLLIVGMGKIARDLARKIKNSPDLGFEIIGIVNPRPQTTIKDRINGIPVVGNATDLPQLLDTYRVQQVIIAIPDAQRGEIVELITLCQRGRVDIKVYPDMFAYIAGDMTMGELGDVPLITVRDIALRGWKLSLKRGLDVFGSSLGMVFLSPFLLLTAIAIKLESKGPAFYTQERMGLDGRPFQMIKFRSMRQDAESSGIGWTVENDPRVTRIGRFMRKTSWDEMPQLINVLLGEMSLVGPRPERPFYVQQFRSQIPRYMERHREKAGMTGWAQVNGLRGDTSIAERTAYDLWYVENWSLWLDVKIIIRTAFGAITGRGENAY